MCNLSEITNNISLEKTSKVLLTSLHDDFILELVEKFIPLYKSGTIEDKIDWILNYNIWGFESNIELFESCIDHIREKWGFIPPSHNLKNINYLLCNIRVEFDYIIGNRYDKVDELYISDLEKIFSRRNNIKIKYDILSYFIVKSIEMMSEYGKIIFIVDDSILIDKNTEGIRRYMFISGTSKFSRISTGLILEFNITKSKEIIIDGVKLDINLVNLTSNFNWSIDPTISNLFGDKTLDEYLLFYEGISINRDFVKKVIDNKIIEKYDYVMYDDINTHYGGKSKNKYEYRKFKEIHKKTITRVFLNNVEPYSVDIPNNNYIYYNNPSDNIIYDKLDNVVYWGDDGDIINTYHNVNAHFVKNGITWQLKSTSIRPRYINNCITDIGSPVCELKQDIPDEELYFIMAWLISDKCNNIIKSINKKNSININDIKRLPYPFWVSIDNKSEISNYIKFILSEKISGVLINSDIIEKVNLYF